FSEGWREASEEGCEAGLEAQRGWREAHAEVGVEIAAQGTVRIWFSSHSDRNVGVGRAPRVLGRLAAVGVSLVHDVGQGA
ncbi:hypothetical protein, partial [Stenotrophomonas sp. SrG]|uniref:hypothetical protein n=1 Tax=Stenotrophomonas sp. SrG TaxID=3414430 RepID=UPI003CE89FC1